MVDIQVQAMPKYSRQRIFELARPKTPKSVWITPVGPRVQWGTQDMLWPVSTEALSAPCTPRLVILSEPKRNYLSGEKSARLDPVESSIWRVSPTALKAEPSPRILDLAEPKRLPDQYIDDRPHHVFSCGRPSTIWQVSPLIRNTTGLPSVSNTLEMLSKPKALPREFTPHRDVITDIPTSALKATPSERLETLSAPKRRPEGPYRSPLWPVSEGARSATPSSRCLELSRPKPLVDSYLPPRQLPYQVSKAARTSGPTPRLEQLAVPNVRASMDHVQFDPNAFSVKQTALKSVCSSRIEQLAQPIKR